MARDTAAVLLAAGSGRRAGGRNKALLPLAGEPLLAHSLRALAAAPSVVEVVLVLPPADHEALAAEWAFRPEENGATRVVSGGAERWLSSQAGCRAAAPELPLLLVHDAARPLVTPPLVEAVLAAARQHGAALAAVPLADTLKEADAGGRVRRTLPREGLWRAQTPQAARRELLLAAFSAWPDAAPPPTDEAALLEAVGEHPVLVAGPPENFKVTVREDLLLAEAVLARRRGGEVPA